jgi:O-antigen/teichoic acid export membrane protein
MIPEARVTIRNLGWLSVQRGFLIVGGLLFALTIPRLMGPETFGQFALVTSIAMWFSLLSGLGATQLMSRFVPQFVVQETLEKLQKFLSNLLALRLLTGITAGSIFFLFTALWLRELSPALLLLVAGSVALRTGGNLLFSLFLGLNQAARWGVGEILRQWISLVFLFVGFHWAGLTGALLGFLLTELLVLVTGFFWARLYIVWSELRLDLTYLRPFLRFSMYFFASNMLITVSQRGGEVLVRLFSGDYAEVGYFGLAYRVFGMAHVAMWQLVMAFAPLLATLFERGQDDVIAEYTSKLLKGLAVVGVLAGFGVVILGQDLVPLAFGAAFQPVALDLLPLTVALLTSALSLVARLLALTYNRPGITFKATVVHVVGFWGVGPWLVAWEGSFGGCLAVLVASLAYAGYFAFQMGGAMKQGLRQWGLVILLATPFLPLVFFRHSWPWNLAIYPGFVVAFAAVLHWFKLLTFSEIRTLWQVFKSGEADRLKAQAAAPPPEEY